MDHNRMIPDKTRRGAIVLAGGEGVRLAELTRQADGLHVPKQFCALIGKSSLLEETRGRVMRSVTAEKTWFVLNREHERFFSPLLANVSSHSLIVQPRNKGTAPAILYSLLRVAGSSPRMSVLLLPSDHHVEDEAALMNYVDLAFAAVEERPEMPLLLGVTPDAPETGYGWIEPVAETAKGPGRILRVRRFWEKPSREHASELLALGCFWNTLMLVGQVSTLLGLFICAMPELYASLSRIRPSLGTAFEKDHVAKVYEGLRTSDFSRQVLETVAPRLSVLPIPNVGWSDLGEPHRVARVLANQVSPPKETAA
jgi:mannose-1-phosphate guanylyltransferase